MAYMKRNVAAEIKHLGLKMTALDYIIAEYRRSCADMPAGCPVKAAKAICEDFGLSIDPQILVDAAR